MRIAFHGTALRGIGSGRFITVCAIAVTLPIHIVLGAFTLAGAQARCATVARFLANLWDELAREPIHDRYVEGDVDHCPGDRQ